MLFRILSNDDKPCKEGKKGEIRERLLDICKTCVGNYLKTVDSCAEGLGECWNVGETIAEFKIHTVVVPDLMDW